MNIDKNTKLIIIFFLQDEYNWPYCTNGDTHNISRLLMAQIIPKDLLVDLATKLHNVRLKWKINQFCHSPGNLVKAFSDDTVQTFAVSWKLRPMLLSLPTYLLYLTAS